MNQIENVSQRKVTLTLIPGEIPTSANPNGRAPVRVELDAARGLDEKPSPGARTRMTLAEMAKASGRDAKELSAQLDKSPTLRALQESGTIRVS